MDTERLIHSYTAFNFHLDKKRRPMTGELIGQGISLGPENILYVSGQSIPQKQHNVTRNMVVAGPTNVARK